MQAITTHTMHKHTHIESNMVWIWNMGLTMSIAHKFCTCDGYLKDKLWPKEGPGIKLPI